MKSPLNVLLLLAAANLASAATIHAPPKAFLEAAASAGPEQPSKVIRPNTYFAVLSAPAGNTGEATRQHEEFRKEIQRLNINYTERLQFTDLINAISFELKDEKDVKKIATIKSVKDVYPMISIRKPRIITEDVKDPQLKFSHGITGVQEIHDTMGLTGKGIKVGVIDSGIDYKHPALGGCFGKGCRVEYGYDFVGDAYDGTNAPIPDEDPRDTCNGHGVHVAGIIGAKDKDFVGVAPEVTLGAYRVFGCHGSTDNDVIIAAMERAYKDKMDIINLSLGGGSSWADYPDGVVADKLAQKGMIVVAAMGNDGEKGLFEASSPGLARKGFGVASFDNTRYYAYSFGIDNAEPAYDVDYASSKEGEIWSFNKTEIASAYVANKDDLACAPLEGVDLKGKIALVQRGTCTFIEKAKNVQAAGAIAALVYNRENGAFTPSAEDPEVKIKLAGITQANGRKLLAMLKASKVTVTFGAEKKVFDNPTGGKVSGFSSWGPGPELELKPDIGAPGGLIYSTYPLDMGGYATLSGTSMATPYTAGVLALFLQKNGKGMKPEEIRDLFKNTARPTTELGTENLTPVQKQGAGMINLRNALLTTTTVAPSILALNSTDAPNAGKRMFQTITIRNNGKRSQKYTLSHRPALSVNPFDKKNGGVAAKPEFKAEYATVSFSQDQVIVPAGSSKKVQVNFVEPKGLNAEDKWLYSGYIVAEAQKSWADVVSGAAVQTPINVPYSGMKGEYRKIDPLGAPESGFPLLMNLHDNSTISKDPETATYTLKENDFPFIVARLVHPVKKLVITVTDAKNKVLGIVPGGLQHFLGRNDDSEKNYSIQLPWQGQYVPKDAKLGDEPKTVESGKYHLQIMALRPFGLENRAEGYQTWNSPAFTIDTSKDPAAAVKNGVEAIRGRKIRKPHGISEEQVLEQMRESVKPQDVSVAAVKA